MYMNMKLAIMIVLMQPWVAFDYRMLMTLSQNVRELLYHLYRVEVFADIPKSFHELVAPGC